MAVTKKALQTVAVPEALGNCSEDFGLAQWPRREGNLEGTHSLANNNVACQTSHGGHETIPWPSAGLPAGGGSRVCSNPALGRTLHCHSHPFSPNLGRDSRSEGQLGLL